jgi:AcrR family transcriptional regulator
VDAARRILTERGTTDVSIQDITETADVGFGTFYNHFDSKAQLFDAAVVEALEEHVLFLRGVTEGLADPAEVFAVRFRLTARLATRAPAVAALFVRAGLDHVLSNRGLAPEALRDLGRAIDAGRFTVSSPTLGLVGAAGSLITFLHVRLTQPGALSDADADELTEQLLVGFGMNRRSARALAHRPLPGAADGVAPAP